MPCIQGGLKSAIAGALSVELILSAVQSFAQIVLASE